MRSTVACQIPSWNDFLIPSPVALPSQRIQNNAGGAEGPSCYHLLESFSPVSRDVPLAHRMDPPAPTDPSTLYTQSFLFTRAFQVHLITGPSSAYLVPECASLSAPLHHLRPMLPARIFLLLTPPKTSPHTHEKLGEGLGRGELGMSYSISTNSS